MGSPSIISAAMQSAWKRAWNWCALLSLFAVLEILAITTHHFSPAYLETLWPQVGMPLTIAFAGIVLVRKGVRRQGMLLATLYFSWYMGVLVLNGTFFAFEHQDFQLVLYRLLFVMLICYPLAHVLVEGGHQRMMRLVLCSIVLWFAIWSAVSVYYVFTGQVWQSPFNPEGWLGMRMEGWTGLRLYMFAHPNIAAAALVMSALLAVYLGLTARGRRYKLWHGFCCLFLCMALGLTESRTSVLAFSAGVAFVPFLWMRQRMVRRSSALAWVGGILCAGLMALVCVLGLTAVSRLPQVISAPSASAAALGDAQGASAGIQGGSPALLAPDITMAPAVEAPTAAPVVAEPQRGFLDGVTTLNSRTEIWSAALRTIASNPSILLQGVTMERTILAVAPQVPGENHFVHLHNSYLEVLLGMGLPGFGLLLAMLWVFGRASLRLMMDVGETTDLGTRFLPAVLVASLIIGMMEPFYFAGQYFVDRLFFLVAGLVVVLAGRLKSV